MKVITLNNESFKQKCSELIEKVDFNPDIVIGVQNGGAFVLKEFKVSEKFNQADFEVVKIQRKDNFKNIFFAKLFLKYIPLSIADRLRVYEHNKVMEGLRNLSRDQLSSLEIKQLRFQ